LGIEAAPVVSNTALPTRTRVPLGTRRVSCRRWRADPVTSLRRSTFPFPGAAPLRLIPKNWAHSSRSDPEASIGLKLLTAAFICWYARSKSRVQSWSML